MDQMKQTMKSSEDQIARTISNWNESTSEIGRDKTTLGAAMIEKQENLKKKSKQDVMAAEGTQPDEAR